MPGTISDKGKENNYGESSVKLPIKWMAVVSLNDGIFSEKTDVVRIIKIVFILNIL